MAKLDVVIFPDERLRQHCKEVTVFDDELKQLAEDMFETMYADDGVGLAAPQVGISKRLVVMEVPFDEEKPEELFKEALVNPVIIKKENPMVSKEGCLSVPDYV